MTPDTCATSETNREPSLKEQFGWLGKFLVPHKTVLICSFALSGISTALGMVQPYFAKILIDKVLMGHQSGLLFPILAALVVILLAGFGVRVSNSYIYTRYSARILFAMREDLFAHLQKIPLSYFSKNRIGDIYSRIASDMADIQAMVTDVVPKYVFDILTFAITVVILFWLHWQMAAMSLVFLPLAVWLVRHLKPKLFDLSNRLAQSNADIAHFLYESLSNTAVIRAFGAEKTESEKLGEKQSNILGSILKLQILGAVSGAVPTGFSIINTLIVFGYGGWQVLEGGLSIGSLVAFSVYQGRVFGPLQGLLEGVLALQKSKVAIARVRAILDIAPDNDDAGDLVLSEQETGQDLVVDGAGFSYDPDNPVFRNISFTVPQGRITALAGESGVGKTTLCRLLLRLYSADSGAITWAGRDIRDLDRDWFRRQVAMVSQETFLFHTTILENIRFFKPDAGTEAVKQAARAADLHAFIQSLPQGYDTLIGDRGAKLSGGQKQRLAIARAILSDPKILILDEATAFLDARTENRISRTLKKFMTGRTIILISHRQRSIRHAHRVVVLGKQGESGKTGVVYEGPVDGYGA